MYASRLFRSLHGPLFRIYETHRTLLPPRRKWRILFSRKLDWEPAIDAGFRNTPHEIAFNELSRTELTQYDLVVPLTLDALTLLDGLRDLVPNNPIPIPSLTCINLCDDKYLFNKTLIMAGFNDIIPTIDRPSKYPYILKKRVDEWGMNSHVILNSQVEESFTHKLHNPEYFRQEFILVTTEFATHIVFINGTIICSLNIKYVFNVETPIKGVNKPIYMEICSCPYLDIFSQILAYIGFDGLCCFNYKVDKLKPAIFEINPRFGGSLSPYFFSFVRHLQRYAFDS